jgi:hypothetical protein
LEVDNLGDYSWSIAIGKFQQLLALIHCQIKKFPKNMDH